MFFWIARFVMWVITHVMFRFDTAGVENIPREGGFLLCSNHIHGFDPVVLTVSMRRRMSFMAKKELFRTGIGNWFFRALGSFPVDRGAMDLQAYKTAMKKLQTGNGLMMFVQGTRMQTLEAKDAKGGAAVFALKTGVPVIPVGITASYKWSSKVHIRYGPAVPLADLMERRVNAEVAGEATGRIVEAIRQLCVAKEG